MLKIFWLDEYKWLWYSRGMSIESADIPSEWRDIYHSAGYGHVSSVALAKLLNVIFDDEVIRVPPALWNGGNLVEVRKSIVLEILVQE